MKTKITLSFVLLLTVMTSFAQRGGRLFIQSENNETFFVFINGQKLNQRPQAQILVTDLVEPSYHLTVIVAATGQQMMVNDVAFGYTSGQARQVNYKLKRQLRRNRHRIEFVSMVPVDYRAIVPRQVFVVPFQEIVIPVDPAPQQPIGCPQAQPMRAQDFSEALATVKKQNFDDTRLKIAQQIVGANCLNTDQIVQMTKQLSFENNKLEFAKFAYAFCTNRGLYFKVNEVFSFSSSVEALTAYVQANQ